MGNASVVTLALVILNGCLLAAGVWVATQGLPVVVLLPLLIAVSGLDLILVRSGSLRTGTRETEARAEAMRRVDTRRRGNIVDETTGLYTRWYFDRRIEEEAARCRRYKHSMAVVILRVGAVDLTTFSVDGWQQRSHDAARRAAGIVREVDISAALSPFEFAICLIHCDRDGAYRAVERLVKQLPDYSCEAGIAVFPDEGYEASALLDLATARLRPLHLGAA